MVGYRAFARDFFYCYDSLFYPRAPPVLWHAPLHSIRLGRGGHPLLYTTYRFPVYIFFPGVGNTSTSRRVPMPLQ